MRNSEAKLRELVEDWRERADTLYEIHKEYDVDNLGQVGQLEVLADELERVIENGE